MARRKKPPKTVPMQRDVKFQPVEGVEPEAVDGEAGHVIVVTQFGLAMLVAGLRAIREESPEVEPLLETLEGGLREGMEERMKAAAPRLEKPVALPVPKLPWEK